MDLGLTDRATFVAGASSGLGYATAARFLREGARVAICSRSQQRIDQAAARLAEETGVAPSRILALACDVTSESAVRDALDAAAERFGGLHVLVANAGGPPSGPLASFGADDWRGAIELNLMSTIYLCTHARAHLVRAVERDGHGRIVVVTSISAKQPVDGLALSNTARAGVQGYAKSLARDLGPSGVTVNTILPGYTRTERLADLARAAEQRTGTPANETEAGWSADTALGRLGEPEEFAAAVAFLASRPAAYITGVALPVDGGWIKGLL
jgi:3-oxoacyl-[acyl-carrier protein] reductase